jgi:hypothetical protein
VRDLTRSIFSNRGIFYPFPSFRLITGLFPPLRWVEPGKTNSIDKFNTPLVSMCVGKTRGDGDGDGGKRKRERGGGGSGALIIRVEFSTHQQRVRWGRIEKTDDAGLADGFSPPHTPSPAAAAADQVSIPLNEQAQGQQKTNGCHIT